MASLFDVKVVLFVFRTPDMRYVTLLFYKCMLAKS